jgi:hypothetical protein
VIAGDNNETILTNLFNKLFRSTYLNSNLRHDKDDLSDILSIKQCIIDKNIARFIDNICRRR